MLKVAELKEELKTREIPLTGLKLKADFVAKLQELEKSEAADAEKQGAEEDAAPDDTAAGQEPEQSADEARDEPTVTKNSVLEENLQNGKLGELAIDVKPDGLPSDTVLPEQVDMYSSSQIKPTPLQPLTEIFAAREEAKEEEKDGEEAPSTPKPSKIDETSALSSPVSATELIEDSKKRKRRSATPPLSTQDVALKKARARDGTPITTKQELSLEQMQAATDAAEAIQAPDGLGNNVPIKEDIPGPRGDADVMPSQSGNATGNEQAALWSPSIRQEELVQDDRGVVPAQHPATKSLYLCNFKRPLQVPALRKHLTDLAQSKSASDHDPIELFHLDNIRTHALVSFNSIVAAARVRSSMHETIFPDEASRMPIWIDFVPDDKVEAWITKETSSNDRNRKWEVVYEEGSYGMEAVHQEVDAAGPPRKPTQPRNTSVSEALSRPPPVAPGVHLDRAAYLPRQQRPGYDRGMPSRSEPKPANIPEANPGTGFKALDELFSSTTAKPKLYYKPAPTSIVEDRLEMMKDLKVPHSEMGKSGDEGMKRYSFEVYKGREEWVDKGPEFGYGARGVAALEGRRGRGGYRGGRGDRGRGGDSWRGRY